MKMEKKLDLKNGEKVGEQKSKIEMAKKMLKENIDIETIVKINTKY